MTLLYSIKFKWIFVSRPNYNTVIGFRSPCFGLSEWTTQIVYKWLLKLIHSFNTEFSIWTVFTDLNGWVENTDFLDYVPFFQEIVIVKSLIHWTTQHGGRDSEVDRCLDGDRQRTVVRGLCDVWRKIKSTTFPTDEQNKFLLCPGEGPTSMVVVWIRCLSVRCIQPHMYPRSSTPSDSYSNMYVKDVVLWRKTVGNMVDVSQVMIDNTIIFKIHDSRLTTLVCNEFNYIYNCTEFLVFLTMNLEHLSPLLSDSPFLWTKSFFVFPIFYCSQLKTENHLFPCLELLTGTKKSNNDNCRYWICRYWIFWSVWWPKTKIETEDHRHTHVLFLTEEGC